MNTWPLKRWRQALVYILFVPLLAASALLVADFLYPPDIRRSEAHSAIVLDKDQGLLRGFTTADGIWRFPAGVEDVDRLYLRMLVAYEDKRFYRHPGVDPLALGRAFRQWVTHRRIVSGGSTLTMQVARLLYSQERSFAGKLRQILRALQLEWHYDKKTILAWYLQLAPFGGNLEGVRAGSLAYFGKEPAHLSAAQAALLVILPQRPSSLRPDRFAAGARRARDKVIIRMRELGILSETQSREALATPVPAKRYPMPFHAPHLAQRLRVLQPRQAVIQTFIDGDLQKSLAGLLSHLDLAESVSAALLVVENDSLKVRAYVGSSAFFDAASAGQIDMVRAIRSPGSVLKPIIYGMGFDDLVIHPETLVNDVPTRFGNYSPTNFQNAYLGQISVRTALQRSQNIPAVAVLQQIGPARVAARLRNAGIRLFWPDSENKPGNKPGLPLALGGVGVQLQDLVKLFAGIANSGQVADLRLSQQPGAGQSAKRFAVLSPAASWYLQDILRDALPPENELPPANDASPHALAYKTGTSYGYRDAWAIGFDNRYTVGVWLGRPDGAPNPGHYGRNSAAPLLYRVFALLPAREPLQPGTAPPAVLLAKHDTLPPRLQYLHAQSGVMGATGTASTSAALPLRIAFPVDGSTVELPALRPLPLVASGGERPVRWLVNGLPLRTARVQRKAFWTPDGEGAVRVTVIDGKGSTASAAVWLKYGQ